MAADKKTMRLPNDVVEAIRNVRVLGGYQNDTAALCAIVRIASPAIISRLNGFSLSDVVPTLSDVVPTTTDSLPVLMSDSVPTMSDSVPTTTDEDDPVALLEAMEFDDL
jgi:hypothetical protein